MCAPRPIPANAYANARYYTPRAALAVAFENGAVDAVTANPPMDAPRSPCALPALPDTIAEARRAIDREALSDIVFHAVLLAALVAVIVAAFAR